MDVQEPTPRLRLADRSARVAEVVIDDLLPPEHPARDVVEYVRTVDLWEYLASVRAVEGSVGRDATDPAILLALWMYATAEGVGSARRLARLTIEHSAFRWIAGGVSLCHRVLSAFRSGHGGLFEHLMTTHVAALLQQGLITLERVAQDGMRVRASAGADTFRREPTLDECVRLVEEQLDQLRRQDDDDPDGPDRRARAAQERRAKERLERLRRAKEAAAELSAKQGERMKRHPAEAKERKLTGEGRGSPTDPEARRMKMADGGFRPAFNVQTATAVGSGIVVALAVTNQGNDGGLLGPMLDQIEETYDQRPTQALVDGGYASRADVEDAHRRGLVLYAPLKNERKELEQGKNPYAPKAGDGPGMKALRARMGTDDAKASYRDRASTAEWTNAGMRQRGLYQTVVRGATKVRAVVALHLLYHNWRQSRLLAAKRRAA